MATLKVTIDGREAEVQADRLFAALNKIGGGAEKLGDGLDKVDVGLLGMGARLAAITAATAGLVHGLGVTTDAWGIQEQAIVQVHQALASTRGVVGLSSAQLQEYASNLQLVTTYGDETTLQAESMLLTFTKISGEVFPEAIERSLDLATRMKGDLTGSLVMVGKALNDPIANLSALGRAWIQFDNTQKKMIKTLWESGERLEAQKIILGELENQFGGSARAAADTWTGSLQQLHNVAGDLLEVMGKEFAEILYPTVKLVTQTLSEQKEEVRFLAQELGMLLEVVNLVVQGYTILVTALQSISSFAGGVLGGEGVGDAWNRVVNDLSKQLDVLNEKSGDTAVGMTNLGDAIETTGEKAKAVGLDKIFGDFSTSLEDLTLIEAAMQRINGGTEDLADFQKAVNLLRKNEVELTDQNLQMVASIVAEERKRTEELQKQAEVADRIRGALAVFASSGSAFGTGLSGAFSLIAMLEHLKVKGQEVTETYVDQVSVLDQTESALNMITEAAQDFGVELSDSTTQWIQFSLTIIKWIRRMQSAAAAAEAQGTGTGLLSSGGALAGLTGTAGGGATLAAAASYVVAFAAVAYVAYQAWDMLNERSKHQEEETWGMVATIQQTAEGVQVASESTDKITLGMRDAVTQFVDQLEELANFTVTGLPEITIEKSSLGTYLAKIGDDYQVFGENMAEVAMAALLQGIKRSDLSKVGPAVRDVINAIPSIANPETLEAWMKRIEAAVQIDQLLMSDTERAMDTFKRGIAEVAKMAEEAGLSMETTGMAIAQVWENERDRILAELGYGPDRTVVALGERDAYNQQIEEERNLLRQQIELGEIHLQILFDQIEARAQQLNVEIEFSKGLETITRGTSRAVDHLLNQAERIQENLSLWRSELEDLPDPITVGPKFSGGGKKGSVGTSPVDTLATLMGTLERWTGAAPDTFAEIEADVAATLEHVNKMRLSEEERAAKVAEILAMQAAAHEEYGLSLLDRMYQATGDEKGLQELQEIRFEAERIHTLAQVDMLLASGEITDELRSKLEDARDAYAAFEFPDPPAPDEHTRDAWDQLMDTLGGNRATALAQQWEEWWDAAYDAAMTGRLSQQELEEGWLLMRQHTKLAALDLIDAAARFANSDALATLSTQQRWQIEQAMLLAEIQAMRAVVATIDGMEQVLSALDAAYDAVLNAEPPTSQDPGTFSTPIVTAIDNQTDDLARALEGLGNTMYSLLTGSASPLTPKQQLDFLQEQYDRLKPLAMAGNVDAINQLQTIVPDLAQAALAYYGDTASTQYGAFFSSLIGDLANITGLENPLAGLLYPGQGGSNALQDSFESFSQTSVDEMRASRAQAQEDSRLMRDAFMASRSENTSQHELDRVEFSAMRAELARMANRLEEALADRDGTDLY